MEKNKTELSLNKNFTFSTKFGISSPTFVGFFVCGMMGRFGYGHLQVSIKVENRYVI